LSSAQVFVLHFKVVLTVRSRFPLLAGPRRRDLMYLQQPSLCCKICTQTSQTTSGSSCSVFSEGLQTLYKRQARRKLPLRLRASGLCL
jgi:hypothetical protein